MKNKNIQFSWNEVVGSFYIRAFGKISNEGYGVEWTHVSIGVREDLVFFGEVDAPGAFSSEVWSINSSCELAFHTNQRYLARRAAFPSRKHLKLSKNMNFPRTLMQIPSNGA